jgi:hypothetical protein
MADTGVNSHCMFADGAKISNFIPYSENPKVQDLKTSGNSKILYYVQGRKMKLPFISSLKIFLAGADTSDVIGPNHGTIIANIIGGEVTNPNPDYANYNGTLYSYQKISFYILNLGFAPKSKLFVLDIHGSGKFNIPANLTTGFLRWVILFSNISLLI